MFQASPDPHHDFVVDNQDLRRDEVLMDQSPGPEQFQGDERDEEQEIYEQDQDPQEPEPEEYE